MSEICLSLPGQLTDVQMLHVFRRDGVNYSLPKSLGYYREPRDDEFPLNLNKSFKSFVNFESKYDVAGMHCFNYIMQLERPLSVLKQMDIFTSRGTLVKLLCQKDFSLLATRFRGCIYLKARPLPNYVMKPESQFVFKLRQYLTVDEPGNVPDGNSTVDLNKQNFGVFSANLGKFRLLYTAEVNGVYNTEPLGDLSDPEVLKQCRLTSVRVYPQFVTDWRRNYRMKRWLLNAYLVGVKEMKFAACKYGLILKPIITENVQTLIKMQSWNLSEDMQLLHLLFTEINQAMTNIDCPHTTFVFTLKDHAVSYKHFYGKNEHSFLTDNYVEMVSSSN